jgi:hypothetical protein
MAVIHSLLRHSACTAPAVSQEAASPICCRAKAVASRAEDADGQAGTDEGPQLMARVE